jgi:hypothetical protein
MTSSALLASGAPPSPLGTASGFSSSLPGPENVNPPSSSLGVETLFRALSAVPPPTPFSGPTPQARSSRSQAVGSSLEVLAPTNATTPGAPCCRRLDPKTASYGRGSPNPRRCRPQGSCPSRRFRLFMLAARSGSLRTPPCAVAPDASRPCFMPLASLERPFRAFPSRGAVPALAGHLLPCEFVPDHRRRRAARGSRSLSPRRQLFARATLPEEDRGRMSRDCGFPAIARSAAWTRP